MILHNKYILMRLKKPHTNKNHIKILDENNIKNLI